MNGRKGKVRRICLQCNKEFYVHPSQAKRGGRFCSISCATTYRNLTNNPAKRPDVRRKISENHAPVPWLDQYRFNNYKGLMVKSYRTKAFRFYGRKCMRCGSEDRLEVHHKDRDRSNNELSNLEVVCFSCHQQEHIEELKQEAEKRRCPKTGRFLKKGDGYVV